MPPHDPQPGRVAALQAFTMKITDWLFRPSTRVTDPGERKQAELLATLTLFFALLNFMGLLISSTVRGANVTALMILGTLALVIFGSYLLSRTRHFALSGIILLSIWTFATLGYAYSGHTTRGPLFALMTFMPLGFILGSALLSLHRLMLLVAVNLAGLFFMPVLQPKTFGREFATTAGVLVCLGGLALIAQNHRNNIEKERLKALREANQELKALHIELAHVNDDLEIRIRERTAQLETSNQELEAFSYSVSHDLRAPLRAVNGYAKILEQDYINLLPAEAQTHLGKIQTASNKMGKLIDELLAFSRLGRNPLRITFVDLNALTQLIIESLAPEIGSRQIEWVVADLPPAQADPILVQQVFANLINNAVKYTRDRQPARITIGALDQNDECVYFIRDNGAGFDMQYADKLFGVFQRLHRDEEFEGTGIGLATVHRIITRHGGRIWAEAEPDKGATFYFTLE